MAEGARLESVYAGNRIEGSNPSLSAITTLKFRTLWLEFEPLQWFAAFAQDFRAGAFSQASPRPAYSSSVSSSRITGLRPSMTGANILADLIFTGSSYGASDQIRWSVPDPRLFADLGKYQV